MSRIRFALLATAATTTALVGCNGEVDLAPVPVDAPHGVSAALQPVVTVMRQQMSSCGIPGGAIAVVQNGAIVDQAGLGARDESGPPVDPSTLFLTSALTKVVDGVAALRLVEQGKLDLTQPVTRYVPLGLAAGFDPSTIVVSDLFAQTSGLPDVNDSSLVCPVGAGQLATWFAANATEPLWTPPGSVWNYSQRGYAAAGWVIEATSGQALESTAASLVFGPGGMTTATYDPGVVVASGDYALGHEFNLEGRQTAVTSPGQRDCAVTRAADGVYASVLDYANLAQALLASQTSLLTPASVASLERGQGLDGVRAGETYGFGLNEGSFDGHTVVHVQGDMNGYDATFMLVPDQGFGVVVLYNADNKSSGCRTDAIAGYALESYLGLDAPPAFAGTVAASAGAPFVGTYVDPYELGTIQVTAQGSTLTATTSEYGLVVLTQVGPMAFGGTFGPHEEDVLFEPDASGAPAWFVTRLGVGARQ